jgi:hypothetical protein
MTAADLQGMIAAAVTTAQAGNRELAQAVTKGIADAREPIPENKFSPEISALNPLGDRAHPRPDLKCDFFWGTMDANTKQVNPTYPLLKEDLSAAEIVALNTLEPMNAVVKLYDGSPIKVSIIPRLDQATDALQRLVVVVPQHVIGKGSAIKNMLPNVVDLVRQVTGVDYAALPLADLAFLMAEHRAKRYIGALDLVAA